MQGAVHQAHVDDNALVGVVVGIENQGLQGGGLVSAGWRDLIYHLFHNRLDVDARLGGNLGRVLGGNTDHILDFLADALGIGAGQVDFIDHRNDFQPGVHG